MKKILGFTFALFILIGCSKSSQPADTPVSEYTTFGQFAQLVTDDSRNGSYLIDEPPRGFSNVMISEKPFYQKLGSKSVFLHAAGNWVSKKPEEKQTFYLEVFAAAPCYGQSDCKEPVLHHWYGPFEGAVGTLVK